MSSGSPEGSLGQKIGGRMRRVPFLVDSGILQAEIGRQVDNRDAGRDKIGAMPMAALWGTARNTTSKAEKSVSSWVENAKSVTPVNAG